MPASSVCDGRPGDDAGELVTRSDTRMMQFVVDKGSSTLSAALMRVAVLCFGLVVTAAGAAIVPAWGDALLMAGLPLSIAGCVRLLSGRSLVVQYGCGPFLGVMLFFAVFLIAESPGAAARRAPTFAGARHDSF